MDQPLNQLYARVVELTTLAFVRLPDVVIALLLASVALFVASRLSTLTQRITRRAGGTASLSQLFSRVVSVAVLALGMVLVLNALGLGQVVISFIASLGVVGLILGFALQDITRQLASGALLLTLRPFEIGDEIKVKDFQGEVVDVKLLTTVLRSRDGLEILIPNADVYTSPIVNRSRYGMQRFDVTFKTPIDTNLELLKARIREMLAAHENIADTPPLDVLWGELSEEEIAVDVRFWVNCRSCDVDCVRSEVVGRLATLVRPKTDA